MSDERYIVGFDDEGVSESLVGYDGRVLITLRKLGLSIPRGFIISTLAFKKFLHENKLERKIGEILKNNNLDSPDATYSVSCAIQKLIEKSEIPNELKHEIVKSYENLGSFLSGKPKVSLLATSGGNLVSEDIKGESVLLSQVKKLWSLAGRQDYSVFETAIVVQEVTQAQLSGVAYTEYDKGEMLIESGGVRYYMSRDNFEILARESFAKEQSLTDEQVGTLGKILAKIHKTFFFPQKVSWFYKKGEFYIEKVTPIPTHDEVEVEDIAYPAEEEGARVVLGKGRGVSPGINTGYARFVSSENDFRKVNQGDIVFILEDLPVHGFLRKLGGLVIVGDDDHPVLMGAADIGIPSVVGIENIDLSCEGCLVTVDGVSGVVLKGMPPASRGAVISVPENETPPAHVTKLYARVDDTSSPEASSLPFDGVVIRAHSIFTELGVHPKHLTTQKRLFEFTERLNKFLTDICSQFYPRPVLFTPADLISYEYRQLSGGESFEDLELNPILGYRGASRYTSDSGLFEAELREIVNVRQEFANLWVLLPFVRTPGELMQAKRILASLGLYRGPTFKLFMTASVPANVILADKFLDVGVDGLAYDLDNLEALLLGIDRNSSLLPNFEEFYEPLVWAITCLSWMSEKYNIDSFAYGRMIKKKGYLLEELLGAGLGGVAVFPREYSEFSALIGQGEERIVSRRRMGI